MKNLASIPAFVAASPCSAARATAGGGRSSLSKTYGKTCATGTGLASHPGIHRRRVQPRAGEVEISPALALSGSGRHQCAARGDGVVLAISARSSSRSHARDFWRYPATGPLRPHLAPRPDQSHAQGPRPANPRCSPAGAGRSEAVFGATRRKRASGSLTHFDSRRLSDPVSATNVELQWVQGVLQGCCTGGSK